MSLISELKRRNVLRVGAAYVVGAWLVIQVSETLFPLYGLSEAMIRMVVTVLAIGLLPVVVLAWVFELTPEGFRLDQGIKGLTAANPASNRKFDRWLIALLTLAVAYFAVDKFVLDPGRVAARVESARQQGRSQARIESFGDQSIAVLAFRDMSETGDQQYLADGVAEEILNLLAHIPELRVISRSSAFSFNGQDTPAPEIAQRLKVANLLEGSVRKAGNRIRITAQLIDARADVQVWSETYDRTVDDIFAIQDEVAASLVDQLQITLLGQAPRSRRADSKAYDLYLQGKYLLEQYPGDEPATGRAADLLEQSLDRDRSQPDAWVYLALAYARKWVALPRDAQVERAELDRRYLDAIAEALKINPDHAAANAYMAWTAATDHGDFFSAARGFERALRFDPYDWEVLRSSMDFSVVMQRYDIVARLGRLSIARNPLCAPCHLRMAWYLIKAGQLELADDSLAIVRKLAPDTGARELGYLRMLQHEPETALRAFQNCPEQTCRDFGALLVRIATGQNENLADEVKRYAESSSNVWPVSVAILYAHLGETDRALDWLERELTRARTWERAALLRHPLLERLHDQPRWQAMLEQAGIAPRQLADIGFNPHLPGPGDAPH